MEIFLVKPICSLPPLSAFTDGSRTRPTEKEMERRRNELKIIVTTGLGSDVDRYASQSPTLVKQITKLKGKNWKILWGAAGGGTMTQFEDKYRNTLPVITIDSQFKTSRPQDIAYVSSSFAHAYFHKDPDLSSFNKCMESLMVGGGSEADALLNQIKVRQEILQAVCIDIFEEGNEYSWMKKDFVDLYNQGLRMNDMKTAKRIIAERYSEEYTSNSNPPQKYKDYYADYCKKYVR